MQLYQVGALVEDLYEIISLFSWLPQNLLAFSYSPNEAICALCDPLKHRSKVFVRYQDKFCHSL